MTVVQFDPRRSDRGWTTLLPVAAELAAQIAGTDFVPQQMRNNPAMVAAAILYGDEIGVGPMQSLARISVINGRPTLAAEMQRALILQAGHDLWIEESTTTKCTVAGRRSGSDATSRVTWTMDDAKRAGLAGKPPWRTYPRQMLLARASAELARAVFPDSIGGLAATEEVDDDTEAVTSATDPAVQSKPTRRRRANIAAAPPTTTPDAPPPPAPEPVPVPGDDDPVEADVPAMSDGQRKNMMRLFRERGMDHPESRHDYASQLLGREIQSSNDLSHGEANLIIDQLEQYDPNDPSTWPTPEP
jgi:hypothetical protein